MKQGLLLKLKTMSERGVAGEKENAEALLIWLLKKYDLTLEDLEQDTRDIVRLDIMKRYHQLAIQIMVYVAGRGVNAKQSRKYPTQFYVEFTKAEEIQFKELFEHYTAAFEKEYKLFEHAFIVKQKLFAKDSEGMEWDMLTEAEKEELREVYKRAEGMPAYSHHKSLRS